MKDSTIIVLVVAGLVAVYLITKPKPQNHASWTDVFVGGEKLAGLFAA